MPIVPQFASSSYSPLPVYLLPAPPVRLALPEPPRLKMLPAPRVAGLLPAHVPLKIVIEIPSRYAPVVDDFSEHFKTIEEADAELAPHIERIAMYLDMLADLRGRRHGAQ
jgi:hypothetical protein